MTITYMKEPVSIPALLEAHNITHLEFIKISNNAKYRGTDKQRSFIIDDAKYKILKTEPPKTSNPRVHFDISKNGEVIKNISVEDVVKKVDSNAVSIYRQTKSKEFTVINGWTIERVKNTN